MNVEMLPLERLHPAAWNPRILKEKRFKDLCRSLQADPGLLERRPILATLDGTIYGGNQRYRAAQHLGWTTVPAVLDDLSPEEAKARAIRDNTSAGEWQEDEYAALLYELSAAGSDLTSLGADQRDIDRLLASVGVGGEEDAVPEPPAEPITRPGDLWLLGPHRLLCGDSTRAEDVARLMNGQRAVMGWADPPYNVGKDYGPLTDDRKDAERYAAFCLAWWSLFSEAVSGPLLVTPGGTWVSSWFRLGLPDPVWVLAWVKMNGAGLNGLAGPNKWDPILLWRQPADRGSDVIEANNAYDHTLESGEGHPVPKPLELLAKVTERFSASGTLILDPFLGSGTTLIAAHQLGRVCYGMEIEPRYVDVVVKRYENLTGDTATREAAHAG